MSGAVLLLLAGAAVAPIVERDIAVPMRDGVVLRADVRRPGGGGPFPVLVYRTPYGKDGAQASYTTFARAVERGYAVVVQDVRGRYASAGEFDPYRNEGKDGYDTIEWAAAQPWSNGRVGTFGLSYPGAVQWLASLESPPHLEAMVPAMTFSTPRNFFHSGGVFDLSWIPWIWNNIAPEARARKGLGGPRTVEASEREWATRAGDLRSRLPLRDLSELREVAPYYFEWMRHPPGDPWWDWCEIRGLLAARAGQADPRARLLIGPWVHGVRATAATRSGDRAFGPAAAIDYDEVVLRFLDRYVRGEDNGLDREPPVRVFVMGEDAWHEGGAFPPVATARRALFLSAGRGRGALGLSPPAVEGGSSVFESDPAHPVSDPFANEPGAHDYRDLAAGPGVAVFETEPLAEPLTVLGATEAEIHVSADAPDFDLWLKLQDVAPDGTAFNLMSPGLDVVRASYRSGGPARELLLPGRPVVLRLGDLVTGNRFEKGHRIRVVLSGAFMPHFSRNLQTGELETTSARMRPARLTVHHDAAHPSRLVLPVVLPVAGAAHFPVDKSDMTS
jgi:uncharacterized protein